MSAEETKSKILQAATTVFSHSGFAAANVAEIAEEAHVNVALIYRYFESKERLLHAVLDRFVAEANEVRKKFFIDRTFPTMEDEMSMLAEWGWDYLYDRHDLIRVILFELLDDEDQLDFIYKYFDSILLEYLPESVKERTSDQAILMALASFFYGLLPFLMVIAIGDQWAGHYQISMDHLKNHFVTAFNRLYVRHIMDVLNAET